jgi:hypothetical protein
MALKIEIIVQRIYLDMNIIVNVVEEPTSELALAECLVHAFTANDTNPQPKRDFSAARRNWSWFVWIGIS